MRVKIYPCKELKGIINISGSKNACLPILACSLLTKNKMIINNVPNISDVTDMLDLLQTLGVKSICNWNENQVILKRKRKIKNIVKENQTNKIRASYYVIPGMLYSSKKIRVAYPGGCKIGSRPIDFHIQALRDFGCIVNEKETYLEITYKEIKGNNIRFKKASVGACINAIMIAVLSKGITYIHNQPLEPEIIDVITILIKMGAKITYNENSIMITGTKKLKGVTHSIIYDRIEAGSYLALTAGINSNVAIKNICFEHIKSVLKELDIMNVEYQLIDNTIHIFGKPQINDTHITTNHFPYFPTDLQQVFSALLLRTNETSTIKETIYPKRFNQIPEFQKLGAKTNLQDNILTVSSSSIKGKEIELTASDLRCGFALIIISQYVLEGPIYINNFEYVYRGYENIIAKLQSIGINISICER